MILTDVCVCIYDDRLVADFKSKPVVGPPPNFLQNNFEDQGTIPQVSEMAADLEALVHDPEARRRRLQESLLTGLATAPVGQYSVFHENAIYAHGYDSFQAIRFAFM